jgi:hypothetical protein
VINGLKNMPGFETALKRVEAWYECELIDRPLVRFNRKDSYFDRIDIEIAERDISSRRSWILNPEEQVDFFESSLNGIRILGESFPIYTAYMGPQVYAAFYGSELDYAGNGSWVKPIIESFNDIDNIQLDMDNEYFQTLEKMTQLGIEKGKGKFLTGQPPLSPGLDCMAAWRGVEQLCVDMATNPHEVKRMGQRSISDFAGIYDHFDNLIRQSHGLSVNWMGLPTTSRTHIPTYEFAALISPEMFIQFGLPLIQEEVKGITHNIFLVDGKEIARHLDAVLSVPEIDALQWVQGMGKDAPIMQWTPFLKKFQEIKMPVVVSLKVDELERFMDVMAPQGLFLWFDTQDEQEELDILRRLKSWK